MANKKNKIKEIREQKGLTQEEVAKKAGILPNYYAKIERGTINTSIEKANKIAKALGVEVSDIFPS
jgi:putative transcriptional regulator